MTNTTITVAEKSSEFFLKGLNEEQLEAVKSIYQWYFDESADKQMCVLSGAAGTGKTFTSQRIIRYIEAGSLAGLDIAIAAPTHYALSVVEENVESFNQSLDDGETIDIHTSTIHSLLHLIVSGEYDEDGNQILKKNPKSRQPHLSEFDLVVVDECSMIDEGLFEWISENTKTKVLFLGDINQLPPVHKDEENNRDTIKLSPTFTEIKDIFYLKTPVRYQGVIAETGFKLTTKIDERRSEAPLLTEQPIFIYTDNAEWETQFHKSLIDNPEIVKAIAWRNITVAKLNKNAQRTVYGSETGFFEGQTLLSKNTLTRKDSNGKETILLHSCEECLVKNVSKVIKTVRDLNNLSNVKEYEFYQLTLRTKDKDLIVETPSEDSFDIIKKSLLAFKREILKADKLNKSRMWRDFYTALNEYCLVAKGNSIYHALQYSGAITVNQAQGSGFEKVFIDLSDISCCRKYKHRNRLFYTAFTRTKKEVHIYNPYGSGIVSYVSQMATDPFGFLFC